MEPINHLLGITVPPIATALTFFLVPIGIVFINGLKPHQAKPVAKVLVGIILLALFIPLNTLDLPGKSIISFIFEGSLFFGLMALGYLLTFILLFLNSFRKSWVLPLIFFLAYLSFWKGVLSLPESTCDCTHYGFMFWIFAFAISPLLTLLFVWRSIEKR